LIAVKLFGAIIITFACSLAGYGLPKFSQLRLEDIGEMKKAVSFYKGYVEAMGCSAEEAFIETSGRVKGTVKEMFRYAAEKICEKRSASISEIWDETVDKYAETSFFSMEDLDTVKSFGVLPGFLDSRQQSETAEMIINELEKIEEHSRQKFYKEEKLYHSTGVLCGLFISILLF